MLDHVATQFGDVVEGLAVHVHDERVAHRAHRRARARRLTAGRARPHGEPRPAAGGSVRGAVAIPARDRVQDVLEVAAMAQPHGHDDSQFTA